MQRRPRLLRRGVIVVSIALVSTACQSDDGEDGDVEGTPIEEPSTVTEATDEPQPETTPDDGANDDSATDETDATTPADEPPAATTTTLVFATQPPVKTTPAAATSPPGEPSTETIYEVGSIDTGLAPFVEIAINDLAVRLDVERDSIELLTAVLVTWPDSALGCREPDRVYAPVLTDGSVIELGVDGLVYRYHSGGDRTPFPCDLPLDPVPIPAG
jgi:hypothetical protein